MPQQFDVDIAKTEIQNFLRLDKVGMSHIECPVLVKLSDGRSVMLPAIIDAYVSLDQPQKGIHMSRLFLTVQKNLEKSLLTPKLLLEITEEFLKTHADMSQSAFLKIRFELPIKRKALVSDNFGWKSYSITLWASQGAHVATGANFVVQYSSTCPCSAALARQLNQAKFEIDFKNQTTIDKEKIKQWLGKEESVAGTPHGQRSRGTINTVLSKVHSDCNFIEKTIDAVEQALATPLQSAVKREDEQEFARLNASNLMFAEDAARRIFKAVNEIGLYSAASIEARHVESLHPHDAVAIVSSGTGFQF